MPDKFVGQTVVRAEFFVEFYPTYCRKGIFMVLENERSFETGRISVMRGSRRVLVKVVLFQLRERGDLQDDATPDFFPDSKCPL